MALALRATAETQILIAQVQVLMEIVWPVSADSLLRLVNVRRSVRCVMGPILRTVTVRDVSQVMLWIKVNVRFQTQNQWQYLIQTANNLLTSPESSAKHVTMDSFLRTAYVPNLIPYAS